MLKVRLSLREVRGLLDILKFIAATLEISSHEDYSVAVSIYVSIPDLFIVPRHMLSSVSAVISSSVASTKMSRRRSLRSCRAKGEGENTSRALQ